LVQNFPLPRHGADEGVVALLNRNSTLAAYISALRKGYRPDVVSAAGTSIALLRTASIMKQKHERRDIGARLQGARGIV
jgi:hypothetical protein